MAEIDDESLMRLRRDMATRAPDSITCPRCGRTSYNPNDVREGYCGACHDWTSDGQSH